MAEPGGATGAQWQAALDAVTYTDTAITPNPATRTISFSVIDVNHDTSTASRTVTVTDTDQTPIVTTTGGSTSYVASSPSVIVDSNVTVSDKDNSTLSSATVSIGSGFQPGDTLQFTNTTPTTFGNILASYNATTGVLTMTSAGATATLTQWGNALSNVSYATSSSVPGARTIDFAVNDGTKTSTPASDSVAVISPTELSALTFGQGTLTPAFAPGTANYSVTVPYTVASVDVTPTLADVGSTLTVNGSVYTSGNAVPINLNVGPNAIPIVVTAQGGATQTYTLTVTRSQSPIIDLSASSAVVTTGQALTVTGAVYDGGNHTPLANSAVTLSGSGGTLLSGGQAITSPVYTDSQGQFHLTWQTPATPGIYTLTASDGGGTQTYSVDVKKPVPVPVGPSSPTIITQFFTEQGQVGQPYAQTIREVGGTFPMTWSVVNGALPLGLTLDNQGNITGTPTTAGWYTFTAQVKDARGLTSNNQLTTTVAAAGPVTVTTPMDQTVMDGHALNITFHANGGTAPYTWNVVGALPSGLRLDSATGNITGAPQQTGVQRIEVEATDTHGVTSTATMTVDVLQPNEGAIRWNGHIQNVPTIVENDGSKKTTYMPIWYVMRWLKTMNIASTWNGHDWHMTSALTPDLSNIQAGSGSTSNYLNGTLIQKVNTTAAVDFSTSKPTTYMPIWYVQQLLSRVGLTSTWDGVTWTVTQKSAN